MTEPQLPTLTDPQKRKVVVRAFFKPLNTLTLVAGLGVFFTTGSLWILPVTLAVYAVVVYLAMRDPVFVNRVIGKKPPRSARASGRADTTPERRAHWLPRGQTRERVEAALVTYRKVLLAIEESDDVTRKVLEDSVPRLHIAAERLVEVAEKRERAAATISDFGDRTAKSDRTEEPGQRESSLDRLEAHIEKADEEITGLSEQFLTLRAQVVRASMDSAGSSQQASNINSSLDELNFRLEALDETLTHREDS